MDWEGDLPVKEIPPGLWTAWSQMTPGERRLVRFLAWVTKILHLRV